MKNQIISSLILTLNCALFFGVFYVLLVWGIAQFVPGNGKGVLHEHSGNVYRPLIAQAFSRPQYFWPRPSAAGYNAAGSGGSNKGPSNPEYLLQVKANAEAFRTNNQLDKTVPVPIDAVTASGSGLDPHISVTNALLQVKRIAAANKISESKVIDLVNKRTELPLLGFLGPTKVNVLLLNLDINAINR